MPAPYVTYVSYAPEGRLPLRAAIEAAKAGDPLAPVTVAVPSNYAGLSLRRDLASQPPEANGRAGLLNVRFMVLARVAELAGAPRLAAQGRRPLTTPFRMEAVRGVLLADPGPFEGLDPQGAGAAERSLDRTFRDLDRCTDAELATLAAQGERAAHVVALYRAFREETRDFYDDRDLAEAAAEAVRAGDAALTDIGHVIGYLLPAPTPAERAFLDALAERGRARVFAGLTGDSAVDGATRRGWAGVAVEGAPDVREATGTGVVLVNDAEEEVREAIREVAARLEGGLPLHRVAFLYRHASPYALIAAEQLEVAGLPWNGPATRRLAQTAAGRTLLGFLALQPSGHRREAVSTWLTSAPIREQQGGRLVDGHRWDGFAREASVIGGREQWLDRLRLEHDRQRAELAAMEATEGEDGASSEGRIAGLRRRTDDMATMREFIGELFERSEPEDATTWLGFATWGRDLLARYVGHEPGGAPEEEVEAHRAIMEALEELGNLDDFQTPPSLAAFTAAIERALDRPAKRVGRFGHGVFLGRLSDAAGANFDLVVVFGMNEGAIPAAGREDPLLPDEERGAVEGMARRESRMLEERRDYLAALASAGERLLFVARADLRGQQARLASRWLLETASTLAGERVAATTLEACTGQWFRSVPSFEAALLGDAQAASLQEHDLRDLARWRAGGGTVTSHALTRAEAALAAGFEVQRARRGRAFERWNGYVPDAAARSPYLDDMLLSATALQGYASCPFSYFLGRLLRVASYEVPEDELTITPLTKGSLIHEVLEAFIKEAAPRETPEQEWTAKERARLQAIGAAACDAYEARGMTGRRLLWEAARERILLDLDRFLDEDQALRREFGVVPVAPEMAFGMEDAPEASIDVGEGRVLHLRGKIDRLDRSPDGRKLVVLDYKTGSSTYGYPELKKDPVHRGKLLQLPLYAAAALQREDSHSVTEVHSYYWFITDGGKFERIGYPVDEPQRQRFQEVLSVIGDSIQDGIFPARSGPWRNGDFENCKFCDYKDLCPADRNAAWGRIRDDERLARYVALVDPEDGA